MRNKKTILGIALISVLLGGCMQNWWHPLWTLRYRPDFQRQADAGDLDAMYNLADTYCCGPKGYYYDTEMAMEYWCKAAKRGHTKSQLALGKLYQNSFKMEMNTIPKNDIKAYMWFTVAEKGGSREAAMQKRLLHGYMTEKNLARAEEYIANWEKTRCTLIQEPEGPWVSGWSEEQEKKMQEQFNPPKDFGQPHVNKR